MKHENVPSKEKIVNASNTDLPGENATSDLLETGHWQGNVWNRIFCGPDGIRSGWRLMIYVVILMVVSLLLQKMTLRVPAFAATIRLAKHGTLSPQAQFLIESVGIISAFVAAWIISRIEKRKFGAYGIPLKGAFGQTFWLGIIIGLIFESTEMLGISAMGGFSLEHCQSRVLLS